jgi:hypothetical protein
MVQDLAAQNFRTEKNRMECRVHPNPIIHSHFAGSGTITDQTDRGGVWK